VRQLEARVAELEIQLQSTPADVAATLAAAPQLPHVASAPVAAADAPVVTAIAAGPIPKDCMSEREPQPPTTDSSRPSQPVWSVIGHVETMWPTKNGTPRQGRSNPASRGRLTLPNADCCATLADFSHVWIIFHFHLNVHGAAGVRNRVTPPRLPKGFPKPGMLATRTPHRFSPIGLSLVRLLGVEGATLLLAEVDLVDGTPVADVKPYLPWADSAPAGEVRIPAWLHAANEDVALRVLFQPEAEIQVRSSFTTNQLAHKHRPILLSHLHLIYFCQSYLHDSYFFILSHTPSQLLLQGHSTFPRTGSSQHKSAASNYATYELS